MSPSTSSCRDRIYIIQDIILKLIEYGELSKTGLIRSCGLNLKKHRHILDRLQVNGLICVIESSVGKRRISTYKPTQSGIEFCRTILEPFGKMFPRRGQHIIVTNNHDIDNRGNNNKEESSTMEMEKSFVWIYSN